MALSGDLALLSALSFDQRRLLPHHRLLPQRPFNPMPLSVDLAVLSELFCKDYTMEQQPPDLD